MRAFCIVVCFQAPHGCPQYSSLCALIRKTLSLTLAPVPTHTRALYLSFNCGHDDPAYTDELAKPPAVVHQAYHPPPARGLVTSQNYGNGVTTPSSQTLPSLAATSQPIRIMALWDVITVTGDTGVCTDTDSGTCTYMCTSASSSGVSVKQTDAKYSTSGFSCADKYAAGPTSLNWQIMQGRTADAIDYWQRTLNVTRVQDAIAIEDSVARTYHLPLDTNGKYASGSVANFDLVLIMTARPSPNSPIAGYALCVQQDQFGRCTVGQFNWVPEVLDQAGWRAGTDSTKESELHTALHEVVHVLGGMGPGVTQAGSNFIQPDGTRAPTDSVLKVASDPAYPNAGKLVTYIKSPKVLNFTRTYFACPTAEGFPLEDVTLGKGAHWEARVAGPELMSYGANSGQVYISDLTLGYLEDTGHYLVDYSKAGAIVAPSYDDSGIAGLPSTFPDGATGNTYVAPPALRRGIPRWGYQAGCTFLGYSGLPRNTMGFPYTCTQDKAYMCTSDNRMSAVCVVQSTWNSLPLQGSHGAYLQSDTAPNGPQPMTTGTTSGNTNSLPSFFQWYPSDSAAGAALGATGSAATTGGYNDAMDYIPVPVGYWNCMFQQQSGNSSASPEGGFSISSITSKFGSSTDMAKFGGQARCPSCRCLNSSLIEMSSGNLNPDFPRYGLCYRTNCARPDYLQIAVKGQLDSKAYWYRCPTAGGKLYIPGFFGSLMCPPAVAFCALEPITAVRYAEQDAFTEAIFWGIIVGGAVLSFLICTCPVLRNRCINCSKGCCGARVFDPPGGHAEDATNPKLPHIAARTLCGITSITLCAGLATSALMIYMIKTTNVYTGTINILGVGLLLTMLSIAGIQSTRVQARHGPSCWLLAYFFMNLAVVLLLLFVVAWNLAGFGDWTAQVRGGFAPQHAVRPCSCPKPFSRTHSPPTPPPPTPHPRRRTRTTSSWWPPAFTLLKPTPRGTPTWCLPPRRCRSR